MGFLSSLVVVVAGIDDDDMGKAEQAKSDGKVNDTDFFPFE